MKHPASNSNKSEKSSRPQQVRGAEQRSKMEASQKKGEEYRASHQGRDSMKTPNSSNTQKSHKS